MPNISANLEQAALAKSSQKQYQRGVENIREDMNQLATKEDLRELKDDVKELRKETQSLRKELHEGINGVRTEFRDEFKNFREEILARMDAYKENILHRWISQSSVLIMTATAVIIGTIAFMHR